MKQYPQSVQATYEMMKTKLRDVVPDFELQIKAEIAYEINRLKAEKDAIILGHNYMEPALFHSIPDFVGDSLELSRKAAQTDKQIIVFCGVEFMAETAKLLNPNKTVLLPAAKAGCSLASSITADDVRALKARFPGVPVVTYVNTYADVKAETDICCTSGNAVKVVESLDSDTIASISTKRRQMALSAGTDVAKCTNNLRCRTFRMCGCNSPMSRLSPTPNAARMWSPPPTFRAAPPP